MSDRRQRSDASDAWIVAAVALAARLAVVVWAASRFPPAGDGTYYDTIARRIAGGHGYTWLWPDGAVTYAAHYPIGYPALVGGAYAIFGASPAVAMVLNALFGAGAALAGHRLLAPATSRALAFAGALGIALHPALVPYTAAIMTEGVTTALLCIAAALAERARAPGKGRAWAWLAGAALSMGVATLVRPQCVILAPVLGWLAVAEGARARDRARAAITVSLIAIACCLPWTARNCVRMGRCALVSVNGGWNLLIGAQTSSGAWVPVDVPSPCRNVWDEAAKDACFEQVARESIARSPGAWALRVPAKLGASFDYFGAAPWYLNLSNGRALPASAKVLLGGVETVVSRLLLIGALVACARREGPRLRARRIAAVAAIAFAFTVHAWPSYFLLAGMIALLGARALARMPLLVPWTAAVILATAATHAGFFGAGRYGLVVVPLVTLLAFVGRTPPSSAKPLRQGV